MPAILTDPSSRFGWPGARLVYRVRVEGAPGVALGEAPAKLNAQLSMAESSETSCSAVLTLTPAKDAGFD
jgi:hypothetical protein